MNHPLCYPTIAVGTLVMLVMLVMLASVMGDFMNAARRPSVQKENPNFPISFDMVNEMRTEYGLSREE